MGERVGVRAGTAALTLVERGDLAISPGSPEVRIPLPTSLSLPYISAVSMCL
ncbi:MAG: hypothetical protein M3N03_07540 [Actinomycetota bacterium]|nr:hypothetical protein [Actinomycetota bacterium]